MPKAPAPLVFPDASVYLDLITRNKDPHKDSGEERWKSAIRLFQAVNGDLVRLGTSALVEAEVICNGATDTDKERIIKLVQGWFYAPATSWTDVDRILARDASKLMDTYRTKGAGYPNKKMGTSDALHLASAIRLGANYFMAQDEGFPFGETIGGVKIVRTSVVWQEQLDFDAATGTDS